MDEPGPVSSTDDRVHARRGFRPPTVPMLGALKPFSRAGGFYATQWRRFLLRSRGRIPVARPSAALAGHALLDEVMLAAFRLIHSEEPDLLPRLDDETAAALALFDERGWLDAPTSYHGTPLAPSPSEMRLRTVRGARFTYERLTFESGYEPHPGEPGRDRWLGYEANRRTRAWLLRHDEPRPWLVCVHGARMGRPNIDLTLFRARWLHEELGLNVAFPVQPLHGPRRRGAPRSAMYPGPDLLDNLHGATQMVWDVRRLLAWIRSEEPAAPIGLTGVSLGGYASALVASFEDDLACAILGVPCVDLVGLVEHHAGVKLEGQWGAVMGRAHQLGRVVAPLALEPAIPLERRFVYAGVADRLVHPRHQVVRLWEHWGRPEIHWYSGGHVLFSRSEPVWRFLRDALAQAGLVDRSAEPAAPSPVPL